MKTYFGKGEYAVTDKNCASLVKAVNRFAEDGGWSWKLQDCLGVCLNGTIGKRFNAIASHPEVPEELREAMKAMPLRSASDIHRINPERGKAKTSPADKAKLDAAAELLNKAGWTEYGI